MRKGFIAASLLSLGMSAVLPSVVRADDWHHWHDRDEVRSERHDRDRDYAEDVSLREIPGRVMDRVDDYRHGRRIEYARLVHERDREFYRFRIDDRDHGDFYLDVDRDGHVIRRVNL